MDEPTITTIEYHQMLKPPKVAVEYLLIQRIRNSKARVADAGSQVDCVPAIMRKKGCIGGLFWLYRNSRQLPRQLMAAPTCGASWFCDTSSKQPLGSTDKTHLALQEVGRMRMTIKIVTTDGSQIQLDESTIVLFAGPYPHDVGEHTYIHTSAPKLFVTFEDVEVFAKRLPNPNDFAVLTRPNLSPVRINGSAVLKLRKALGTETPARTIVLVQRLHQAVMEDRATARQVINAHGGSIPPARA
jgi:hypothetical protein